MGKHANSPLTPEGWRRLCERVDDGRPISHVADEGGVSRQRLTVWYRRWEKEGAFGLEDHSSRPLRSPNVTPDELVAKIEELRRDRKWGPDRISGYLTLNGDPISQGAVYKVLVWQQVKTHCPLGHEYTPGNTYQNLHGRSCRTCHLDRERRPRDDNDRGPRSFAP